MGAEMRQVVLKIAFDGGAYHGFQLQPGAVTVQQRLEEAASRLFSKERVVMHGCSRTDAGVSAREFYCTFAVETALSPARAARAAAGGHHRLRLLFYRSGFPSALCGPVQAVQLHHTQHPLAGPVSRPLPVQLL